MAVPTVAPPAIAEIERDRAIVDYRIEIRTELKITAEEARRRATRYLLANLGNQVSSGETVLIITPGKVRWKCPVLYGVLGKGTLGQIGELVMDVETGDVIAEESSPALKEMERRAEDLYNAADGRPL